MYGQSFLKIFFQFIYFVFVQHFDIIKNINRNVFLYASQEFYLFYQTLRNFKSDVFFLSKIALNLNQKIKNILKETMS